LKISKALKKSKRNPIKINEIDDNIGNNSDNAGMDKREKNRAIKSVMDILKLETKESITKKKK
jgi:hypothetical protein